MIYVNYTIIFTCQRFTWKAHTRCSHLHTGIFIKLLLYHFILVLDRVGAGKGWQQRRMDVDHAVRERAPGTPASSSCMKPASTTSSTPAVLQPGRHRAVARPPGPGRPRPRTPPSRRPPPRARSSALRAGAVADATAVDLDAVAAVHLVQDRLQVGARARDEDRDREATRRQALAQRTGPAASSSSACLPFACSVPSSGYSPVKQASQCVSRREPTAS